jgi:tetratricopeptide (TPR) repeat protein
MSRNSLAQTELSRALSATGAARIEALVKLSQRDPTFAPVWGALAEEHWKSRRREEALQAARRALRLDPSLHARFTRELSMASRNILAEVAPASVAPAQAEAPAAQRQQARTAGPSSQAARELEQAGSLVGYRRRNRLEELSRAYPEHAPIWLALAEENLAQRSVNHALDSLDQALALDPSLENLMSPELERARKYTHREPLYSEEPDIRPTSPDVMTAGAAVPGAALPVSAPGAGVPIIAAGEAAPVMAGGTLAGAAIRPAPEPPRSSPLVSKMLATALALRHPGERIAVLQELFTAAPDDTDVLFHLAQELALDGRTDAARDAGNRLRELSPERYADLYAWAEERLTAQAPRPGLTPQTPQTPPAVEAARGVPGPVERAMDSPHGGASESDASFRHGGGSPRLFGGTPNPAARSKPDLSLVLSGLESEHDDAPQVVMGPPGAAAWELVDDDEVDTMKVRNKGRPRAAEIPPELHDMDMDDEVTTKADIEAFRARYAARAGAGVEVEEEVTMRVSGKEQFAPPGDSHHLEHPKTDRMEIPEDGPQRGFPRADSEFTTRPLWLSGAQEQDAAFEPPLAQAVPAPIAERSSEPSAPVPAQPGRRQLTPSKHVIRRASSSSTPSAQGSAPRDTRSTPVKPDTE